MDWGADMSTIPVARGLLLEILKDGTCPLHVRMELQKALVEESSSTTPPVVSSSATPPFESCAVTQPVESCSVKPTVDAHKDEVVETPPLESFSPTLLVENSSDAPIVDSCKAEVVDENEKVSLATPALESTSATLPIESSSATPTVDCCNEELVDENEKKDNGTEVERSEAQVLFLCDLPSPCLLRVAAQLPLAELLAVRACSQRCLTCFTQRALPEFEEMWKMQSRIRARLWIERMCILTKDTIDETVFDTKVRSFANDALRRRMESEMADAKVDMERQIHAFQVDVDRRMEEQAQRVHAIIEERVHQQVEMILSAEMEKVRVMAEERVQERVRTVLQEEVLATVREMQARLTTLAQENEQLRNAFAEHLDHSDLCYRSLVWALSPNATGFFARTLRFVWCCRRRLTKFSAQLLGVPPDRRKERLRMRLEALRRALDSDENLRARLTAGEGNVPGQLPAGANGEGTNEGALPPMARPLMALMAAAQSADMSVDGTSLNPVHPDLATGSPLGTGEFSVTESASATATVIAAALLLASQANRRNAGGESGRSGGNEANQSGEEVQVQALQDGTTNNTTSTIEEVPSDSVNEVSASTTEDVQNLMPETCNEPSSKADEVTPPIVNDSTACAATDQEQCLGCETMRVVDAPVGDTTAENGEVTSNQNEECPSERVSPVDEHEPSVDPSLEIEEEQVVPTNMSYDEVAEATASAALEAAMEELVGESNEEKKDNADNSESGSAEGICRLEEISEWGEEEEEEDLASDPPVDSVQQDSANDCLGDDDEAEDEAGRDSTEETFYDLPEDDDEDFALRIYDTLSEWDGEIDETFEMEDATLHSAAQSSDEKPHDEVQVQVSETELPQPHGHQEEAINAEEADWI